MTVSAQAMSVSLKKTALRRRILNVALTSPEFRNSLNEAASEIRSVATPDATEATVEGAFESVLYALLRDIGLKFHPSKEQSVEIRRHVSWGRIDSRLGALVIEYKRPSQLKTTQQVTQAISQLKTYLIALSAKTDIPFTGLITNGLVLLELRARRGEIISISGEEKIDERSLLRLTQQVISLAFAALTPANLIRDFCGSESDGILFNTARVLNTILSNGLQKKTEMLFFEWEAMFRLAHDDNSQQRRIEERRLALSEIFLIDIESSADEYRALFALHTAYAILLKFMAYRTISDIHLGQPNQDYQSLAVASNTALRVFCNDLEDGEVFRLLGIINLLEGDFFSWYCDRKQWTPALADAVRSIVSVLARYEEVGSLFDQNEAPDLFRDLYQAAVPRVVRSSFGEFYTPHWLAEHVLEAAHPVGEWRAIDPCCGSGTFVIAAISRVRRECEGRGLGQSAVLDQILSRVVGIDLNPLSVLTARINYFIHVSDLLNLRPESGLVIPIFLGDAASIPDRARVDGIDCLRLELKTLQNPVRATLPISCVRDTPRFMQLMLAYEHHIKSQNGEAARNHLLEGIPKSDRSLGMHRALRSLTEQLIDLEAQGWNGIWARIISNFLTTACLGKFDIVFGNPPWIDWKNLPQGYRERIKAMCIERGLFSGAGRTGGINLNICALISYASLTNWLDDNGVLAFLMPRGLANQASYEGWRRLGGKWHIRQFDDWSKAGYPFDPVREDFMTFLIGRKKCEEQSIPVRSFVKRRGAGLAASNWPSIDAAMDGLQLYLHAAQQIIPDSTAFTIAKNQSELDEFSLVSGGCEYIGREGIEFYPQELLLFHYNGPGPSPGTAWLKNIQVSRSKYKIPERRVLLETEFLYPLVKGPQIAQYNHCYSGLVVAFPYDPFDPHRPIPAEELRNRAPLLFNYYMQSRELLEKQTKFSDKIRGSHPGEFYGLARTGPYSFAEAYVAFRDSTKWRAVVVTDAEMPWGERKRFVFQNHAVSMCERYTKDFIDESECHFICAILNTAIVERFVNATSDKRSYKIRPPVFVPIYDPEDDRHQELVALSREAHAHPERRGRVRERTERIYLGLCEDEVHDEMIARDRIGDIESGLLRLVRGDELQRELEGTVS